jgi:hypothetical protein
MAGKDKEWSNSVPEDVDREVRTLNPRERHINSLIEKNKDAKPRTYRVTNNNAKAMRVIHDFWGTSVSIQPAATKEGVELLPNIATYLGKGDLKLEETAA